MSVKTVIQMWEMKVSGKDEGNEKMTMANIEYNEKTVLKMRTITMTMKTVLKIH